MRHPARRYRIVLFKQGEVRSATDPDLADLTLEEALLILHGFHRHTRGGPHWAALTEDSIEPTGPVPNPPKVRVALGQPVKMDMEDG